MLAKFNKSVILILLSYLCNISFSQSNWFHYNWDKYDTNYADTLSNQVYWQNMDLYKKNGYAGKNYQLFSCETAIYLYDDIEDGNVYKSFEGGENYVRRVLKTIVNDTVLLNSIKIVFYRDASLNASMSENGLLRLNVGMLARLTNEAELALLLGHEIGHFVNFDEAKYFRKKNEVENFETEYHYKYGWLGSSIIVKKNYWYSRDYEEAADLASLAYIKKSLYSLKAAGNLYRMFKRLEIRNMIKYEQQSFSSRTHPDPGDRMKTLKDAILSSPESGKKNFIVDSLEFLRLKELCFMETANICLMENNLDELITLTFSRYLLEPQNEPNLALLIEALRRYLFINPKNADRSFILSAYQTKKGKELENYPFLLEKTPSILNNLNKGLIDIWKEDVNAIKAKDLLDPNVIEFTTTTGAYTYFKAKAAENKYKVAEHYKYFGSQPDLNDNEAYKKINNLFLTNDYLSAGKSYSSSGKAFIIMPVSGCAMITVYPLDSVQLKVKNLNSKLFHEIKSNWKKDNFQIYQKNDLSIADRHLIENFINICRRELDFTAEPTPINQTKKNWVMTNPELFKFFKEKDIADLYLCVPDLGYVSTESNTMELKINYYKISYPADSDFTFYGFRKEMSLVSLRNESFFFNEVRIGINIIVTK